MIKGLLLKCCFLIVTLCCYTLAKAQKPPAKIDSAAVAKKRIQVVIADSLIFERKDSVEFQSLIGHVIVKQEKTTFYCDSAIINRNQNVLEAFGHVHINDADSVNTYSDYLRYVGNDKKAFLRGNVKLTDGKGVLTAPELEYTTTTKVGIYSKGGKLVNAGTVLTSKEGYYYGETRDAVFKKNVKLVDPEYTITTDTLLYNTYTEVATFTVPTTITGKDNSKVVTSSGFYESKTKKTYFGKRPSIQMDKHTFLDADEVASDSSGFGEARGNAVYRDTAQGVSVIANNIKTNRNDNSFLATQHPVMVLKQADSDSLFIAADTLYSGKLSDLKKSREVPDIRDYGLKRDFAPVTKATDPDAEPELPVDSSETIDSSGTVDSAGMAAAMQSMDVDSAAEKNIAPAAVKMIKKDSTDKNTLVKADSSTVKKIPPATERIIKKDSTAKNTLVKPGNNTVKKPSLAAGKIIKKDSAAINTLVRPDTSTAKKDSSFKEGLFAADTTNDSLNKTAFLIKDTARSTSKDDSTNRFFEAYFNVRIYSDSMQAVADSLFYSGEDSVFRLFRNPIIWTKENQITGDTIYLYTQNKNPKRMYVFENALAINKVGDNFYNQVKGRTINSYFVNGNIDQMRAKGAAESIYYAQDENNRFVGVNKANADIIDSYFKNRKPERVVMRVGLKGVSYPMRQVNHEEIRLRGFKWIQDRRPKSKYELFGN